MCATSQLIIIYQLVAEKHNTFIHPVLLVQCHDGMGMVLKQAAKQGDIETAFAGVAIAYLPMFDVSSIDPMAKILDVHTSGGS